MRAPAPPAALLAAWALLALCACDGLPGRPNPADRYRRPGEILDFATLYATQCSACHGADGTRGAARPLADPLYLALVGRERVREVVARGIAGTQSPAFARSQGGALTDAQVDALVEGIFATWSDPARSAGLALPAYAASRPGDPARGARSYVTFCARCHGADGAGGEKGGSVVDPRFLALVSDQMLRLSVILGRPDLGMPDWRSASETRAMTEAEIADVVAWMVSARVPVPVPEGPGPRAAARR